MSNNGCMKWLSILVIFSLLLGMAYPLLIQPWSLNWGAQTADRQMQLPGDGYIPNPERSNTRLVTIQAPIEQVWPWLIQMGAERGGFYSYTWLEGLINCPIENADRIHSEWQDLQPGESYPLCPGDFGPPPYQVIEVVPGQALILGHRPLNEAELAMDTDWVDTWAFVLQPVDADTTRLLIRTRNAYLPGWMKAIEPGVFVMERGMLIGLQARAENRPIEPSQEALYRSVFGFLLLGYLIVRFGLKRPLALRSNANTKPDRLTLILTWLGFLLEIPVLIFPFFTWIDRFYLGFPDWLRWVGAVLFLSGVGLYIWVYWALSHPGNAQRGSQQAASFVSHGPYRRVRHPMYLAMIVMTIGMFLLSSNLIVGLPYLIAVILMYIYFVDSEERQLVERFGESYSEYMRKTGRLFPHL